MRASTYSLAKMNPNSLTWTRLSETLSTELNGGGTSDMFPNNYLGGETTWANSVPASTL